MENNEKKSENDEESNKCKVLIIGAGMAGLSAAYHLAKNGFNDYKILEARKRIGGRIIQIKIGPEAVELGANWIHGVLGNPVYELAMHHGLVDIMQDPKIHKVVAATELGKQIPFGILQEIYEAYLVFLRRCEEYYLSQYLPPDGIDSVGDHIKLEINLYLDKFKDPQDRYLRQLLFDCLLKRESCISGCDSMSEIDLLEIGSYTELQGGNITLPGGYSSILEPMKKVISQDKVFLEHAVCSIKWNFNNSSDSGDESDDSDRTIIDDEPRGPPGDKFVEVMCENGNKFFAEHVICTLPLGVLKHNANKIFQPKLPDYKIEAIDRLLFGTVDKIYLEYDRPFLNANITEVLLLWEPDDRKEIDYTKNWYKKIYSFAKVSETLLLGWISGKEAEYMETLPSEVISETCTEILRKFLKDPFIPKPKNCICTSWFSQPFTKGSYTAIAVGASQIDIEYLAQPLYTKDNHDKPIVLFAGEHTHSNFYSTVHGAYLTGRTVAQILLSTDAPQEIVVDADEDDTDLSSWIQGICLD